MKRDLELLSGRTFDLLVVGGGIYGLTIAYDAAQRGLSVALIERTDFGSGASFNHLRTIHGGLRYLQTLDLVRSRESVIERRTIAAIAPHAVRPVRFALPIETPVMRLMMRGGFLLDRLIAFDRNQDIPPSHRLPGGSVVSGAALGRLPGFERQGVSAAAVWHDYVTSEADRLTFSFAIAASEHGAVLANHVEAVALVVDRGRIIGVRARDSHGGRDVEIAAGVVVNATGAAVDRLLEPIGAATGIPMLKAMNLVTSREAGETAIGGRAASGRHLFLVPWRGRALFGTWQAASLCKPEDTGIAEADVAAFIAELNEAFPALGLKMADVTMIHRGIVPAVANGQVSLEGHEQVRDHARDGVMRLDGLVSIVAAKYTTARAVAERVTTRILTKLQRASVPCRTRSTPLPGGDVKDVQGAIAAGGHNARDLPSDTMAHLVGAYGSRYREILGLCAAEPQLATRLTDQSPVIAAELVRAVRDEMALTLADAVVRRTPLGALGYPGDSALDRAADLVGAELGWPGDRREAEIAAVRQFYDLSGIRRT
jgi:glycerol-3-phosphate dehydrogenase